MRPPGQLDPCLSRGTQGSQVWGIAGSEMWVLCRCGSWGRGPSTQALLRGCRHHRGHCPCAPRLLPCVSPRGSGAGAHKQLRAPLSGPRCCLICRGWDRDRGPLEQGLEGQHLPAGGLCPDGWGLRDPPAAVPARQSAGTPRRTGGTEPQSHCPAQNVSVQRPMSGPAAPSRDWGSRCPPRTAAAAAAALIRFPARRGGLRARASCQPGAGGGAAPSRATAGE